MAQKAYDRPINAASFEEWVEKRLVPTLSKGDIVVMDNGTFHSISETHLHRYLAEFDFRCNNRSKLGVEDTERVEKAVLGTEGKRLTYHQPSV